MAKMVKFWMGEFFDGEGKCQNGEILDGEFFDGEGKCQNGYILNGGIF